MPINIIIIRYVGFGAYLGFAAYERPLWPLPMFRLWVTIVSNAAYMATRGLDRTAEVDKSWKR